MQDRGSRVFHGKREPGELHAQGPLIAVKINLPIEVQTLRGQDAEAVIVGLIDTGAYCTCISPAVVEKLSLIPTGRQVMSGATGKAPCNRYSVNFTFPGSGILLEDWPVIDFCHSGYPFDMLIGRDVLRHALFVYKGTTGQIGMEIPGKTDVFGAPPFTAIPPPPLARLVAPSSHPALERAKAKHKKKMRKSSRRRNRAR